MACYVVPELISRDRVLIVRGPKTCLVFLALMLYLFSRLLLFSVKLLDPGVCPHFSQHSVHEQWCIVSTPGTPDCAGFCNKRMISSSPKAGLVKVTTLQRVRVKNMLAVFFYDIDQLKIICLKRSEV